MPDSERAKEILKEYFDTISRARKFVISAAIILIILIVIVGQELREYRNKQASLVKQIQTTAKSERGAIDRLFKEHACIRCELKKVIDEKADKISSKCDLSRETDEKSLATRAGLELWDIPKGTGSVHAQKDIDALVKGEQKLAELVKTVKDKLEREKGQKKQKLPKESSRAVAIPWLTTDSISRLKGTFRSSSGPSHDEPSPDVRINLDTCGVRGGDENQPLTGLVSHLTYYKDLYNDRIALARAYLSTTQESSELKFAKKSIPTPFGNFQIAPRLALLGLAFALLITYFVFYNYVRKIGGLAEAHDEAIGPESAAGLRVPAPFWSPNPERKGNSLSPAGSQHLLDVLVSVLLHASWLFIGLWLVFECVVTWKATKVLAFDYRAFWGYLLIATGAAAVIVAAQQYVPPRLKKVFSISKKTDQQRGARVSRRYIIGAVVFGIVGVLSVSAWWFLRNRKSKKMTRPQLGEFTGTPEEYEWIQNPRNGIIHYRSACKDHLPVKRVAVTESSTGNLGVHAGFQARIVSEIAAQKFSPESLLLLKSWKELEELENAPAKFRERKEQLRRAMYERAIPHFKRAIELNPFSCHLYDRLCKLYGTLGQYAEIQPLFNGGLSLVQAEVNKLGNGPHTPSEKKRLKSLHRREQDFKLRLEQVEFRKISAEEFRAEMAKKDEMAGRMKRPNKD